MLFLTLPWEHNDGVESVTWTTGLFQADSRIEKLVESGCGQVILANDADYSFLLGEHCLQPALETMNEMWQEIIDAGLQVPEDVQLHELQDLYDAVISRGDIEIEHESHYPLLCMLQLWDGTLCTLCSFDFQDGAHFIHDDALSTVDLVLAGKNGHIFRCLHNWWHESWTWARDKSTAGYRQQGCEWQSQRRWRACHSTFEHEQQWCETSYRISFSFHFVGFCCDIVWWKHCKYDWKGDKSYVVWRVDCLLWMGVGHETLNLESLYNGSMAGGTAAFVAAGFC